MSECIKFIGGNSCIEGLNKAIKANRKYHGYTFVRVTPREFMETPEEIQDNHEPSL